MQLLRHCSKHYLAKYNTIRDMFKMGYFGGEFATQRSEQSNPFNKLVSMNGLIVPADFLKDKK